MEDIGVRVTKAYAPEREEGVGEEQAVEVSHPMRMFQCDKAVLATPAIDTPPIIDAIYTHKQIFLTKNRPQDVNATTTPPQNASKMSADCLLPPRD